MRAATTGRAATDGWGDAGNEGIVTASDAMTMAADDERLVIDYLPSMTTRVA